MLGSATLTIDASRTTTNCATQSRINAVHRRSRCSFVVLMSSLLLLLSLCLYLYDERTGSNSTVRRYASSGKRIPVSGQYTELRFRLQPRRRQNARKCRDTPQYRMTKAAATAPEGQ